VLPNALCSRNVEGRDIKKKREKERERERERGGRGRELEIEETLDRDKSARGICIAK